MCILPLDDTVVLRVANLVKLTSAVFRESFAHTSTQGEVEHAKEFTTHLTLVLIMFFDVQYKCRPLLVRVIVVESFQSCLFLCV